jgi:hypothetical protein
VHDPVDRAVVLGEGEQVRDADQDDEEVAGDPVRTPSASRAKTVTPTMNAATSARAPMLTPRTVATRNTIASTASEISS